MKPAIEKRKAVWPQDSPKFEIVQIYKALS